MLRRADERFSEGDYFRSVFNRYQRTLHIAPGEGHEVQQFLAQRAEPVSTHLEVQRDGRVARLVVADERDRIVGIADPYEPFVGRQLQLHVDVATASGWNGPEGLDARDGTTRELDDPPEHVGIARPGQGPALDRVDALGFLCVKVPQDQVEVVRQAHEGRV